MSIISKVRLGDSTVDPQFRSFRRDGKVFKVMFCSVQAAKVWVIANVPSNNNAENNYGLDGFIDC